MIFTGCEIGGLYRNSFGVVKEVVVFLLCGLGFTDCRFGCLWFS